MMMRFQSLLWVLSVATFTKASALPEENVVWDPCAGAADCSTCTLPTSQGGGMGYCAAMPGAPSNVCQTVKDVATQCAKQLPKDGKQPCFEAQCKPCQDGWGLCSSMPGADGKICQAKSNAELCKKPQPGPGPPGLQPCSGQECWDCQGDFGWCVTIPGYSGRYCKSRSSMGGQCPAKPASIAGLKPCPSTSGECWDCQGDFGWCVTIPGHDGRYCKSRSSMGGQCPAKPPAH